MNEQAIRTSRESETARRTLELVQRRAAPSFLIVDRSCRTILCSPDLIGGPLLAECRGVLAAFFQRLGPPSGPAFEELQAGKMLRIVPLAGGRDDCYAAFIESLSTRDSLKIAVTRFDITKREAAVLKLLIGGFSTAHIARGLSITEGTVGDHVESLFRKTNTNSRPELVGRVFGHEDGDGESTSRTQLPTRR